MRHVRLQIYECYATNGPRAQIVEVQISSAAMGIWGFIVGWS